MSAARIRSEVLAPNIHLGEGSSRPLRVPLQELIHEMATGWERELEAECAMLRSELAAMEKLVERYQDELAHARPGSALRRRSNSSSDAYRAVDELFENQALYASTWAARVDQKEMPAYCDAGGKETQFDKVALPSEHWEWVSDWRCDVRAHTDESGWVYALSWDALYDPNQPHRSERRLEDRVRRRRWTRERMLVGSTGLPVAVNQRVLEQSRLAAMQYANEKLSQQLLRANDRIGECEHRLQDYETQVVRLQGVIDSMATHRPSRYVDVTAGGSVASYSVSKSNEVLRESEHLLGEMLTGPGMADLTLAITDVQRRRSEMVEECENELNGAMDEFIDLVETLERRTSSAQLN